jgi:alanine dehydrogenase
VLVGVPKEIKAREQRVGVTPVGVRTLVAHGHRVVVEAGAGAGSGIADEAYARAGATVVATAADAWAADLVVKVRPPEPSEHAHLRRGLVLLSFLHLAAQPDLVRALASSGVAAVAYETVQTQDGALPLLRPMSEIAGRMAVQVGASCLESGRGGKGVLLGGVPGTRRGRVVVLGGGVVGRHAATVAVGMGAQVTVLDVRAETMSYLEDVFGGAVETLYSNADNVEVAVRGADLVIGGVLVTGARAPVLVGADLVAQMEPGSVVVDVAVDQGGCVATSRPTTHEAPTYVERGVVHYGVPDMPGAVPRTSTAALTNVTLGYALAIAEKGVVGAARADRSVALGLNTFGGHVTYGPVAVAHNLEFVPIERALT